MIAHTIEMYQRTDGNGYLGRFWTVGEQTSMIAVGNSEYEVREKIAEHYRRAEEEVRRQEGLTDARIEALRRARIARAEREARKEAAE